jgi:O-antigen ligase
MALGGLLVAVVGLAEASGVVPITSALAWLHDGATPVGDVPRITSTLSHPNVAAIVLELSLPLLVAWAWSTRSWRLLLAGGAAATLLALVLTFSRAGLLAVLAGLALMAAQRGRPRMLGTLAVGLVVVGSTLGWAAVADPGLDRRLTAGLDESSPLQPARTVFWSVALDMQRDHPWLGVGPDNFRWQFAAYSGIAADHLGIHAHNQYLEALADTGLVGLVAQVWLLGALVVTAWRQATLPRAAVVRDGGVGEIAWPWRAAVLAGLVVWVSHAMLDDFERFWPSSVAFWLLCGLSLRLVAGQAPRRWSGVACAASS